MTQPDRTIQLGTFHHLITSSSSSSSSSLQARVVIGSATPTHLVSSTPKETPHADVHFKEESEKQEKPEHQEEDTQHNEHKGKKQLRSFFQALMYWPAAFKSMDPTDPQLALKTTTVRFNAVRHRDGLMAAGLPTNMNRNVYVR